MAPAARHQFFGQHAHMRAQIGRARKTGRVARWGLAATDRRTNDDLPEKQGSDEASEHQQAKRFYQEGGHDLQRPPAQRTRTRRPTLSVGSNSRMRVIRFRPKLQMIDELIAKPGRDFVFRA